LVAVAGSVGSPTAAIAAAPSFTDVTAAAGISHVHANPVDTTARVMHGGGTVGDFNRDGCPDLFMAGGGLAADSLYINGCDGTLVDEAAAWGLTDLYRGNGASAADFDGDGWMDLYVTNLGDLPGPPANGQHKLYRNLGNGTFSNVAAAAGVQSSDTTPNGFGVAWGDYDLDGDLDLFVGGWRPEGQPVSEGSRLFRNDGDGTFTDVTVSAGVFDAQLRGFGAIFADMDGDRYPELLIAGDFGTSRYFINDRDGTFTRRNFVPPGEPIVYNGMGTSIGDIDRDGRFDWWVTSAYPAPEIPLAWGNRMYMNDGGHVVSQLPESSGVWDGGFGWGSTLIDVDHDGWLDLVMTNGWDTPNPITGESYVDEPSYLFLNNGDETFLEGAQAAGLSHTLMGRGLVHLDYDLDGDLDVGIFSNNDAFKLYRNDVSGTDAGWLEVVLDTSGNPALAPHGLGTTASIQVGSEIQHAIVAGGSNYLSRSELIIHFGVGAAATVDELEVSWSDGFKTTLSGVTVNQRLTVAAPLPHFVDPFVRGEAADLRVEGAEPGEAVFFLASVTGTGSGPCPPLVGGLCMDVLNPILLGSAVADATGTATRTVTVPSTAPFDTAYLQAAIPRGPGGTHSAKTNVVERTILGLSP